MHLPAGAVQRQRLRGREDRGRRAAAVVKMMVDKVKLVAYNKKKAETDE